jgi:threonine-phosphate decarboxylase
VSLLIDESFMEFVVHAAQGTAIPEALQPGSRVVVMRSLTKFLAIPGLRLGYAIADDVWAQDLDRMRDRWSVSHLAQVAGSVGMQDQAFRDETAQWLCREQTRIELIWKESPLYYRHPTSVNFYLLQWADEQRARLLSQALFRRGILVRRCSDFLGLGPSYWRIAIRSSVENDALYLAVQEGLQEEGG